MVMRGATRLVRFYGDVDVDCSVIYDAVWSCRVLNVSSIRMLAVRSCRLLSVRSCRVMDIR